ncbi:hypothetical protein F5Y09DRAFT_51548 [Xylaria sp. FL1042]|nr:hypothetical protein F5Y09DRAFT_51548 [Xylaria sp. FL1042]
MLLHSLLLALYAARNGMSWQWQRQPQCRTAGQAAEPRLVHIRGPPCQPISWRGAYSPPPAPILSMPGNWKVGVDVSIVATKTPVCQS